jgi:CO/xanthine dehydrogenase Mo-binding subunit
MRINEDGTVHLAVGVADLGTGCMTTLSQVAAEELGLDVEALDITAGDTDSRSFDRGAYASRTLFTAGNAVRLAALDVKKMVLQRAAEKCNTEVQQIEFRNGGVYSKANPEAELGYKDLLREASQLPLEHWHAAISGQTLADAILDRLIHRAHRIHLQGELMRKKKPPLPPSTPGF